MNKEKLRAHFIQLGKTQKEQMSPIFLENYIVNITQKIIQIIDQHEIKAVIGFCDFGSEPPCLAIMQSLKKARNLSLGLVRMEDQHGLSVQTWDGDFEQLDAQNGRKMRQIKNTKILDNIDSELILVPGLAFTKSGKRLGRGAGYYDRFLARYPEIKSLGLAFPWQIVDELPTQAHDIMLWKTITHE